MLSPPFETSSELNSDLVYERSSKTASALNNKNHLTPWIPDRPGIGLDRASIEDTLASDLITRDLDRVTPYLWLVATPRSSHVLPLHRQAVRGCAIIPCENPALHLVWSQHGIFVRPLPAYLFSHPFWSYCLHEGIFSSSDAGQDGRDPLLAAALGLLRTYVHLIKYPIDFKLAQQHSLIPEGIEYRHFAIFINNFRSIQDADVAPRYTYGELRLNRLNFYTPFLLFPKLTYHHMTQHWATFFGNMLAPILSIFAVISLVLSAMQVGLGVQASSEQQYATDAFIAVSWYVAVLVLIAVGILVVVLLVTLISVFVVETSFALRVLRGKRSGQVEKSVASSSVVQ